MRISPVQLLFSLFPPILDLAALLGIAAFVAFGVWSLHQRFRRLEEWRLRTQLLVLMAIAVFYVIEIGVLRLSLRDDPVYFIFSLLGLFVAGLALYGHIVVSVLSQLLVELLAPDISGASDTPRLGPAEALERQNDWDAALQEYYVLARIYPDNPLVCTRIANNLARLNRQAEAVPWLKYAVKYSKRPEDCLALSRRLFDTCTALGWFAQAGQALASFLRRFPNHPSATRIEEELTAYAAAHAQASGAEASILNTAQHEAVTASALTAYREDKARHASTQTAPPEPAALSSLSENPLAEPANDLQKPRKHPPSVSQFESLETASLTDAPAEAPHETGSGTVPDKQSLDALDTTPLAPPEE